MKDDISKKVFLLLALAVGTQGCARSLPAPVRFADAPQDYTIEITPVDAKSRFAVELVSKSSRELCIGVDDWPNSLGQVSGGAGRATVASQGKMLPAADTNFGYCVGEMCTLRIRPHQTLNGFIGYKEFGDPREIASLSDKHLAYHVRPFECPAKKSAKAR